MAKISWEIENQGFNDAKKRYSFEHTCHHEKNSVLLNSLLTLFALTIERLYRIRYLHRGTHTVRSAEQLCRILWVSLSRPLAPNTSYSRTLRRTVSLVPTPKIPPPTAVSPHRHILPKK